MQHILVCRVEVSMSNDFGSRASFSTETVWEVSGVEEADGIADFFRRQSGCSITPLCVMCNHEVLVKYGD